MKLLSFGEIIWDVFDDAAHIGGAPLNFAAHAAMQGADAYILSAVGNDDLGHRAMSEISALGVKTDLVSRSHKATGRCAVTLDERGVPSYDVLCDTAYDDISAPSELAGFDLLAFGTLALRGDGNRRCLKNIISSASFREIFCDLNIRAPFYSDESILFCLRNATVVKISDEELGVVTEAAFGERLDVMSAALRLAEKFSQIKIIVITLGGDGAYAYDTRSKTDWRCPAAPVEVISTVGAGDSFGATFLCSYFDGKTIPECLSLAARVSGFVVSREGAVPRYDVKKLI